MPNHIHLIAVPSTEDGLRWAIGAAHERYPRRINFREKWRGYLWQGRFASFVMDEAYLLAAARYVELNPVRARRGATLREWPWGSVRAHLWEGDDCLVQVAPFLAMIGDWNAFLNSAVPEEELKDLRGHSRTGRPLGNESFLDRLEATVGRVLKPQKRGPKPKQPAKSVGCPRNCPPWRHPSRRFVPLSHVSPRAPPRRSPHTFRTEAAGAIMVPNRIGCVPFWPLQDHLICSIGCARPRYRSSCLRAASLQPIVAWRSGCSRPETRMGC